MELLSPYGLDVLDEVRAFVGVRSLETFAKHVRRTLIAQLGLRSPVIEGLHVAGAFALTIRDDGRRFVFKLDEHADNAALTALLERVERLRMGGLPLPRVHPTLSGAWFVAPFHNPQATGYLSDFVTGAPAAAWRSAHADATAAFLARFHQRGRDEPVQPGEQMSFASRWSDLEDAVERLAAAGALPQSTVSLARALIAQGPPGEELVWTHIHGDARLCHVLFAGEQIAGVVDHDAGMWGERLLDVAFHLISHPDPALVAFLDLAAIRDWLRRYDALVSLTTAERAALPAALSCALLIELGETLGTIESRRTGLGLADLQAGVALLDTLQTEALH